MTDWFKSKVTRSVSENSIKTMEFFLPNLHDIWGLMIAKIKIKQDHVGSKTCLGCKLGSVENILFTIEVTFLTQSYPASG